jgi:hypothetical protein
MVIVTLQMQYKTDDVFPICRPMQSDGDCFEDCYVKDSTLVQVACVQRCENRVRTYLQKELYIQR